MFTGYSHNERCGLSLGVVDASIENGDELTLVWGEENGGTRKPTVERHRQMRSARESRTHSLCAQRREQYHGGWRTQTP